MAPGFFCVYYFWNLWIHLDRAASENHREYVPTSPSGEKILELMRYLSEHPEGDHTIDQLATRFYMSKYHMMRLFRQETGYTITEYLTEKRLQNANELLRRGTPSQKPAINPDSAIMLHSSGHIRKNIAIRRIIYPD